MPDTSRPSLDAPVALHTADASLRGKSVRGALFMASGGSVELAIRIAATLVLARLLTPEDLGLVGMVLVLFGVVEIVKDLGLATAMVQKQDITQAQLSTLFWTNTSFGAALAIAGVASCTVVAHFYGDDRLASVTACLAATFAFGGMIVQHEALLNRQMRQGQLAVARLVATLLSFAIAIAMAAGGFGYWALVAREVVRSLVYAATIWLSVDWRPSAVFRWHEARSLFAFGRDLTVSNVFAAIIARVDGIVIGKYFGATELGLYRQAQSLVTAPVEQFNGPIFSVAQPGLSALQEQPERYQRYYCRVVTLLSLVTFPIGAFIALHPTAITLLLLGPKWAVAAPYIAIFALAIVVRPTLATTSIVLLTRGRSAAYLALNGLHGVVLMVLMLASLRWGAIGVAVAHVATSVVLFVPSLYLAFRGSPVSLGAFGRAIFPATAATTLMAAAAWFSEPVLAFGSPVLDLGAALLVSTATYLLVLALLPSGRAAVLQLARDVGSAIGSRRQRHSA